jgi:hypothetical protein
MFKHSVLAIPATAALIVAVEAAAAAKYPAFRVTCNKTGCEAGLVARRPLRGLHCRHYGKRSARRMRYFCKDADPIWLHAAVPRHELCQALAVAPPRAWRRLAKRGTLKQPITVSARPAC